MRKFIIRKFFLFRLLYNRENNKSYGSLGFPEFRKTDYYSGSQVHEVQIKTSPRQSPQTPPPPHGAGSPTPLLNKERGDKAQLYRGEVKLYLTLIRKRYNCKRILTSNSPLPKTWVVYQKYTRANFIKGKFGANLASFVTQSHPSDHDLLHKSRLPKSPKS